ncbi:hypothetical protein PR048_005299 [Dryococelus australis]|uniref:Uncharacterized protein n=1 Tax=Dryococelus australis TaxID=614101 RepID=A0ABQ9I9Y9_9NEOP|nr:hypothetical protein PR048_005299 [Dryococelus australis]
MAWELLVERYQNEKLIINTHIDNIMYQPIMATENVNHLRKMLYATKTNIKAIHSTLDAFMIYVLVHRLDCKTKLEWELHSHKCSAFEGLQLKTRQLGKASDGNPQSVCRSQTDIFVAIRANDYYAVCNEGYMVQNSTRFKELKKMKDLSSTHMIKLCKSGGCRMCGNWDHTFLLKNKESLDNPSAPQGSYSTLKDTRCHMFC